MTNTEKVMYQFGVWRTFHHNLCEILQIDPDKVTTKKALELAGMQLGLINGLVEGLAMHADEQGFSSIEEFYAESYAKNDYLP